MPRYRVSKKKRRDDRELVALMAAVLAFVVGYLVAEASLKSFPHPLHWLATFASAFIGYVLVLGWYKWRDRGKRAAR